MTNNSKRLMLAIDSPLLAFQIGARSIGGWRGTSKRNPKWNQFFYLLREEFISVELKILSLMLIKVAALFSHMKENSRRDHRKGEHHFFSFKFRRLK
jgi:hypothetical protein